MNGDKLTRASSIIPGVKRPGLSLDSCATAAVMSVLLAAATLLFPRVPTTIMYSFGLYLVVFITEDNYKIKS